MKSVESGFDFAQDTIGIYESIYNEYADKIKSSAAVLPEKEITAIANEGVSKLFDCLHSTDKSDFLYAEYEKWAAKLYDVYFKEIK